MIHFSSTDYFLTSLTKSSLASFAPAEAYTRACEHGSTGA
jgi:hypothetical protein